MATRRLFCGQALAGLGLAAAPSLLARRSVAQSKDAPRKMVVGVGGFTFAYLPLFVAQATGQFKTEGLDVSFVQTGSGATAMAAMVGGSFDVTGSC
jgi:NitT/TauT family transport system substrate-binding protein